VLKLKAAFRELLLIGLWSVPFLALVGPKAKASKDQAITAWKEDPHKMAAHAATSGIAGQGIFWFCFDQIGFAQDPKFKIGFAWKLARKIEPLIPGTDEWSWRLKYTEIALDFGKCFTETAPYRKHLLTPDILAFIFPQPWWSAGEAGEKTRGARKRPDLVVTREGRVLAIGCILGSLFRFFLDWQFLKHGDWLNDHISDPIETRLRRLTRSAA
jgi:hypothetical protein